MNRGVYPILSGAIMEDRFIQGVAHNIANVNTTGFKQDDVLFKSQLTKHMRVIPAAGVVSLAAQMWTADSQVAERVFVAPNGLKTSFEAGRLRPTGNPYDFAIEGPGFFEIKSPDGARYTRDGVFHLDGKRVLVNEMGYPVMGTNGELKLPPGELKVDNRGALIVNGQTVGKFKIIEFPSTGMPAKVGDGLFSGDQGKTVTAPTVLAGAIEESNVNPLSEMVKMIQAMRTYESAQKVIQSFDRMAEMAVNDLGRVQA